MAKVSIVIPTYNNAAHIRATLESVFQQTYKEFEVLVVDGSSDDTGPILKTYGSQLRLISQTPCGVAAARNLGIQLAVGEYVALLDGDDLWDAQFLEKQINALENYPDAIMAFSDMQKFGDREDFERSVPFRMRKPFRDWVKTNASSRPNISIGSLYETLLLGNLVPTSSVVLRRTSALAVGLFDETFKIAEDWEYWLRLSRTNSVAYVDQPLVRYRVHAGGLSGSVGERDFKFLKAHISIFEKHLALNSSSRSEAKIAKILREHLSFFHYRLGLESLKLGDSKTACREIYDALRHFKKVGLKFEQGDVLFWRKILLFLKPYGVWLLSCFAALFYRSRHVQS